MTALETRHREQTERVDVQTLRTEAALTQQALRPVHELRAREPFDRASIGLFVLGVALTVIGTLS